MKIRLTLLLLLPALLLLAQDQKPEPIYKQVRLQTYGAYYPLKDLQAHAFGVHDLVVFANGCVITDAEFREAFFAAERSDTSAAAKSKFLDEFVLGRQRVFEAMEKDLDTSNQFQLEFLTQKQNILTPYLNEGKTRQEAEALPEVKFKLRRYHSGRLQFELMNREIWSQSSTAKLREFYNNNPALYQGQSFEISRTKVIHDYQKQLEDEMNARIKAKFPFRINSDLVARL